MVLCGRGVEQRHDRGKTKQIQVPDKGKASTQQRDNKGSSKGMAQSVPATDIVNSREEAVQPLKASSSTNLTHLKLS